MKELNKLTKRLFDEGYTKENPPGYVRPYNDFYGGFTYTVDRLRKLVFETPCGLLLTGEHFVNGTMSYKGVEWMPENDNPTVLCPRFSKTPCQFNHELLRDQHICGELVQCACHLTDRTYNYELSLDKAHDDVWKEADRLFKKFAASKHGRVCKMQSSYSRTEKKWRIRYDPIDCAHRGFCKYCDVLQAELSPHKGNVFYDVVISRVEHGFGLFPDEHKTTVLKGEKLLDSSASMTLCEAIVRYAKHRISEKVYGRYHTQLYRDPSMSVEVKNVRAEYRESRDLLQDLRDVEAGVKVIHTGDQKKAAKQQKQERRKAYERQRVARLERLVLDNGMEELEEIDQMRVKKYLPGSRIRELTRLHMQKMVQGKEEPAQLSLF